MAACAAAQAQSGSLIAEATGAAGKSGGLLGRDEEEMLRQHLKRKHAASILSLKEEFLRKRKKGKLPKDATSALKTWWLSNLVWPYPTVRGGGGPRSFQALTLPTHRRMTSALWATRRVFTPPRSTTVRPPQRLT